MAIENDIVLVYCEDSPIFFARVESIWPDIKRDWFNIELLVLQIPVKLIVWTLKDIYINGSEFFMGGKKMKIEVVHAPVSDLQEGEEEEQEQNKQFSSSQQPKEKIVEKNGGQIVSLAAFQKKKKENQQ